MRKQHSYYVYITTNPNRKVLYIGVTNNLARRLVEHYANKGTPHSFAGKYYAYSLIYCEHFKYITRAIAREKELKKWNRKRKEELIATKNPDWKFYNEFFCQEWPPKEVWGNYLEQFKIRKGINKRSKLDSKSNSLIEDNPIRIYEDDIKPTTNIAKPNKSVDRLEVENPLKSLEGNGKKTPKLSKKERYLITLSVLITLGKREELLLQINNAPVSLLSKQEIEELLLQIGLYTDISSIKDITTLFDSFSRNKNDE